jgi:hypothetical protein
MGEEGKVILRVLVNPQGTADSVEIKTSSGSQRLDESAQKNRAQPGNSFRQNAATSRSRAGFWSRSFSNWSNKMQETAQENAFGFAHLWASGDIVSHSVAVHPRRCRLPAGT